MWNDRSFLQDGGTPNPRYTGSAGVAGCQQTGGTIACSSSVPLENTGGEGTVDSHWRESTFNTELMTGFLDCVPITGGCDPNSNPISVLTVGALQDLGFEVNNAAADPYMIFLNAIRAQGSLVATPVRRWENIIRPVGVLQNGRVLPVRNR